MTLEEALIKVNEMLKREISAPESIWVPNFGWVMIDGEITEEGKLWQESLGI